MNIKISDILDRFLGILTVFFAAYYIFGFAVGDKVSKYSSAAAIAFAIVALPSEIRRKKPVKKDYSRLLPSFYYKTNREIAEFFLPYFPKKRQCEATDFGLRTDAYDVMFYLKPDALTRNAAIDYALNAKRKILLVVSSFAPGAADDAQACGKNLRALGFDRFCEIAEKRMPLPIEKKPNAIKRILAFLNGAAHKENSARLAAGAGFMLALSLLNGFSVWFLCFSALMLALSIAGLVRGKSQADKAL